MQIQPEIICPCGHKGRHLFWSLSHELPLRERVIHKELTKKPCLGCGCRQDIQLHFELIKSCEHTNTALLTLTECAGPLKDGMEAILVADPCRHCKQEQEVMIRVSIKQLPKEEDCGGGI